ncbi:MAG: TatD family hydrolase [Caulobacteraceae bacterium]
MLIDSHVNLHAPEFDPDRAAVIERGKAAGVELMVEICDRLDRFAAVMDVVDAHAGMFATVGVHPHEAKDFPHLTSDLLIERCSAEKVVGIGETGLDFHYDHSPRGEQARLFRLHAEAARRSGLPLIVHSRNAEEATAEILEEERAKGEFPILMHCYVSGPKLARRAAKLGAWFSVSGIATFKAAEEVREVIRMMPEGRIMVETDCPYLAPVPMRGRRNEPAFLPFVLASLAELRGWSKDEARERTTSAALECFSRIPKACARNSK